MTISGGEFGPQPAIRPLRAGDLDLVFASWLESFQDGLLRHVTPAVPRGAYYRGQRRLVEDLLRRPRMVGLAAVTPDYDDAVLGWAVAEPPSVLHYVYVKDAFRHLGIARALFAALQLAPGFAFTHTTRRGRDLADEFYSGAHFNPYLLLRPE